MSNYFNEAPNLFCEGKRLGLSFVDGTTTELVNTLSSLLIIFFGAWGLYYNNRNGTLMVLLYSLLAVTGIGSTLYHATFYLGFSFLDSFPMTMCLTVGITALLDEIITEDEALQGNLKSRAASLTTLISTFYAFAVMSVDATSTSSTALFQVLFAVPLVVIVSVFMWLYYADTKNKIFPGTKEERCRIRGLLLRGLVVLFFGAVMWLLDGVLCDKWEPIVYFFGHGIWHVAVGYAVLCLFAFISYLRADNFQNRSVLTFFPSWCPIMPIVHWRIDLPELETVTITK